MKKIDIRCCSFHDLESAKNFQDLTAEYAQESGLDGLPPPTAHLETYRGMEAAGVLHVLCAYCGEDIVGFVLMVTAVIPHYGVRIATTESFFVASAHRKSGAGLQLLAAAEQLAKDRGAFGLFVSAPIDGRLADVLDARKDYRETNRVFFRSLA